MLKIDLRKIYEGLEDISLLIAKISQKKKFLVVGDVILDIYCKGDVTRISPEAPIPILRENGVEYALGGAANVASKISSLGGDARLLGVVGGDDESRKLQDLLHEKGVDARLVSCEGRITTHKIRYCCGGYQVLRVDHESTECISPLISTDRRIECLIRDIGEWGTLVDAIVISDYAKGFCVDEIVKPLVELGKITVVDPSGSGWRDKYHHPTVIKPNLSQFEKEFGPLEKIDSKSLDSAADTLFVTRGSEGVTLLDKQGRVDVPTLPIQVFDPTGAGDAVTAVLVMGLVNGLTMKECAVLSNLAGACIVQQRGVGELSRGHILAEFVRQCQVKVGVE